MFLMFLWCQLSANTLTWNSIWIHNSYFREEIWVSLDEAYYFCGNEIRLRSKICILLKRDMLINESYHISTFWSLREFTDILPFLWHLLDRKLPKMGKKLKQSLEVPILTREPYVSQGKICVSAHVGKSFTTCLLSEFSFRSSLRKWYFQLYFTQVIHWNGKMLFAWQKNCLSKFLWCAAHV